MAAIFVVAGFKMPSIINFLWLNQPEMWNDASFAGWFLQGARMPFTALESAHLHMRGTGPAVFYNAAEGKTGALRSAFDTAFPIGIWEHDLLCPHGYLKSGGHYVAFCERFMCVLVPFVGFGGNYVPRYMARKAAKIYLRPGQAQSVFWTGVSLDDLQRISPDQGDFLSFCQEEIAATAAELYLAFDSIAPEEVSMWYCILRSERDATAPVESSIPLLLGIASEFYGRNNFHPNAAKLLCHRGGVFAMGDGEVKPCALEAAS